MVDANRRAAAIKFCKALSIDCGGKPLVWGSSAIIAVRLGMRLGAEINQVIAYAKKQRWIEMDDDRNVCLTIKGTELISAGSTPAQDQVRAAPRWW